MIRSWDDLPPTEQRDRFIFRVCSEMGRTYDEIVRAMADRQRNHPLGAIVRAARLEVLRREALDR